MALYAQCFLSADLMRNHYQKIDSQWTRDGHLSQNNRIKFRVYLSSWLGYLYATCEGFKTLELWLLLKKKRPDDFRELLPKCGQLVKLKNRHEDDLRVLRHSIFHLRDDNKAIDRFFTDDGERLTWADELHNAIDAFFSNYRVRCEVHYLTHDRFTESQIRNESARRRKKQES